MNTVSSISYPVKNSTRYNNCCICDITRWKSQLRHKRSAHNTRPGGQGTLRLVIRDFFALPHSGIDVSEHSSNKKTPQPFGRKQGVVADLCYCNETHATASAIHVIEFVSIRGGKVQVIEQSEDRSNYGECIRIHSDLLSQSTFLPFMAEHAKACQTTGKR